LQEGNFLGAQSMLAFFPGLMVIALFAICFWDLGQGKDILIAFTEQHGNQSTRYSFLNKRLFFIVGIGYWAFVSSRSK